VQILRKIVAWLRGGTAALNEVESALVSNVLDELPPEQSQTIRRQMEQINLVQRPQPGRMTIMFHRKPLPLLENREYEVCLAQVSYKALAGRKHSTRLMIHSGFLQSIEGRIPSTLEEIQDLTVSLWPGVKSRTPDAIDRLEHGSEANR